MNVLDASALLAFLQGEPGSDLVEGVLVEGAVVGAANWSEAAHRVLGHGRDWPAAAALLLGYGLSIEPVGRADGEAAARWPRGSGLALGDRLCLALGERLDAVVWTADRQWGSEGRIRQIR